jgi:hypothetical protein
MKDICCAEIIVADARKRACFHVIEQKASGFRTPYLTMRVLVMDIRKVRMPMPQGFMAMLANMKLFAVPASLVLVLMMHRDPPARTKIRHEGAHPQIGGERDDAAYCAS